MSLTFCGASVRAFNCSLGWNQQQTSFHCSLVEDTSNFDFFSPPPVGTPVYFSYGAFYFGGLMQRYQRSNALDGFPTFEVDCIDPRQILEGATIITSSYRDATPIENIYNVFGYWENQSFGASLVNDAGIPYLRVIEALNVMTNSLDGDFGRALNYKGIKYSLDLSGLPVPPDYYRLPTPSLSILDLINQVCEDGGYDYFIDLVGYTIRVRVVNRRIAASLGAIAAVQLSGLGVDLIKSGVGVEARNEITGALVIGGERKDMYFATGSAIRPFWGLDNQGGPITGVGSGIDHTAGLNAGEIEDIIGSTIYPCSVEEMCAALSGYDVWATYMYTRKRLLSDSLNINVAFGPADNVLGMAGKFNDDFVIDTAQMVQLANRAVLEENFNTSSDRLFKFVEGYAKDYMGKKFLVTIPDIYAAVEPETLRTIYSLEPTDGGYLPEGSEPLGLPALVEDQFKSSEGTFQSFCVFDSTANIDFRKLLGQDGYLYQGRIYMKAEVDPKVVIDGFNPAVIVTIPTAVFDFTEDPFGISSVAAGLLDVDVEELQDINKNTAGGTSILGISPPTRLPTRMAIPLKSNILTYGPWYLQGSPGKVRFEQDPSLVPWNFGGFDIMNQVGISKVQNSVSFMQEVESGSIELAGSPAYNIGEILGTLGPNVTGIDVGYGVQGITTIYRMNTFTPLFGVFNKDNAKRLERLSRTSSEMRKNLRISLNKENTRRNLISGNNANEGWLKDMPSHITRKSPHTVFMGTLESDDTVFNTARTSVSTSTYIEARSGCGGHDNETWQKTAVMSINGLLRPFSTAVSNSDTGLSHYTTPTNTRGINKNSYDPFSSDNDLNQLAAGNSYTIMNPYKINQTGNKRPLALRGPLVMQGWGQTTDGKFVPGDDDGAAKTSYVENYKKKSHLWKTGPIDLRWDDSRGVWTAHDILLGKTQNNQPIVANGSGVIKLFDGDSFNGPDLAVHNFFSGAGVSGNKNVVAGYCATVNRWYIIAADC